MSEEMNWKDYKQKNVTWGSSGTLRAATKLSVTKIGTSCFSWCLLRASRFWLYLGFLGIGPCLCAPYSLSNNLYSPETTDLNPLTRDLISKGVLLPSRISENFCNFLSSKGLTPGRDVGSHWWLFLRLHPFSTMGHFNLLTMGRVMACK